MSAAFCVIARRTPVAPAALLVALSKLGLIWDVRRAPAHVVAAAIAQPTAGHP